MKKNGRTWAQDVSIVRRGLGEFERILPGQLRHVYIRSILAAGIPFIAAAVSARILDELAESRDRGRLLWLCALGVGVAFVCALWKNYEDCRIEVGYQHLFASHEIGLTNQAYLLPYELLEKDSTRRLRDEVSGSISLSGAGMASLYWDIDVLATNLLGAGIAVIIFLQSVGGMLLQERMGEAAYRGTGAMILGLGVLVILCSALSCRMTAKRFDAAFEVFQKGSRYARYGDYYHMNYLPDEEAAMDARIYHQEELILSRCQSGCYEHLADGVEREYRAVNRYDGIKLGCSCVCGCVVYLVIGRQAMRGAIGCGSIVLLYFAVTQMIQAVARVAEILTDLRNNNEHLLRYFRYMDLPKERSGPGSASAERNGAGGQQAKKGQRKIIFENVSFRYPEGGFALQDVNLTLHAGEKTAIVGENGSGKTTLIKLLCRLYHPTEGKILLDGRDIREYPYEEYIRYIATVFQDFSLFAFSMAENVAGSGAYDSERVMRALQEAGLGRRVAGCEKGIRQPLFHDFDEEGINLSGGEAQKIAIARAIYKDAEIMILDEPTAALDPYAEYEIYENFGRIAEGKTVLSISHRLSSCRMCDKIVVMHQGKVVQRGTHEALLAEEDGKYRELWNAQAQHYT